jgi:hypothetical protein
MSCEDDVCGFGCVEEELKFEFCDVMEVGR